MVDADDTATTQLFEEDALQRSLDERRRRRVFIGHEAMFDVLTGKLVLKLPGRSWIDQVHYDHTRQGFDVILRCPDFSKVPEGEVTPLYHFEVVVKK